MRRNRTYSYSIFPLQGYLFHNHKKENTMKKSIVFLIAALFLMTFTVYAQMDHSNPGQGQPGSNDQMMHDGNGTNGKGMTNQDRMKQGMGSCMDRMDIMTSSMKTMMNKDLTEEQRNKLADTMQNMSKCMADMSVMMKQGTCSMEEMENLEKQISEMERSYEQEVRHW